MDYKWSICKLVGIIQYMLDKMRHIFWVFLKYTFMAISPLSIYFNWCNPEGSFFGVLYLKKVGPGGGAEHIYLQYFRYVSTIFTGPIWVWGLNGRPWPGSNLHDLQNCQTFPNVGVFSLSTCSAHFDGHRTNRTKEISHLKLVNFTRLSLFRFCLLSCSLTQGRR